jgi:hypothetical protein
VAIEAALLQAEEVRHGFWGGRKKGLFKGTHGEFIWDGIYGILG